MTKQALNYSEQLGGPWLTLKWRSEKRLLRGADLSDATGLALLRDPMVAMQALEDAMGSPLRTG